ncbi:50S ribosomal protein L17 [Candidatus Saccharibacteria bacterium]|nr:50S ribosomal protein L17 [Candidatus Saccharibacteria bacterium]
MHRHGYKGRKFGRERDQRNALMVGLTRSLFVYGSITTTVEKAKDLRPIAEKIISKARKGDLANRRAVIAAVRDIQVGNNLVDVIAPVITRDSGYLRIVKLDEARVGDNADMARIEFVDLDAVKKALEKSEAAEEVAEEKKPAAKTPAKKPAKADEKEDK